MSEQMLEKVRKLLAMAEDPACTPAEAEAFTGKAAELIAKYGVDRALLAVQDPTTDPVGDRVVLLDPPYALDKGGLLAGVAAALRCQAVRRRDRDGWTLHLFGFSSDLERAELLYTSLLVQAACGMAAAPVPFAENVAAFRRSWLAGFTSAVTLRLRATEASAATQAGPSTALVLADRSDRVQARIWETYPTLRSGSRRRLAGSGAAQGYAAGTRADLGGSAALPG